MFVWQKLAPAQWLSENERTVRASAGTRLALIERAGRSLVTLEVVCPNKREALELKEAFGGQIETLRNDWLVAYTRAEHRPPLRIGKRLIVTAQAIPGSSTTPHLIIPTGAAFGTGEHVTTALSLRLLEQISRPLGRDWNLADLGTGSGILALGARLFGANRVIGVDNDPLAISTAKENARRNGLAGVKFEVGDVLEWRPPWQVSIVTANLFSELLIQVLPGLKRYLAAPGWLIASGILRLQERSVIRALRQNGMGAVDVRRRGKWIALTAGVSSR